MPHVYRRWTTSGQLGVSLLTLLCAACDDGGDFFGGAALRGDSVTVSAGETARFCVELNTGGSAVAATQNDLSWDPGCLTLVGGCVIEPATGKQLLYRQSGAAELRAIVISLSDTNPIPDGRLYCCSLRAEAMDGCCAVEVGGANASDPVGRALAIGSMNGEICVE